MAKPWTAGIVGCGRIAGGLDSPLSGGPVRTHAQAYSRHPSFILAAIAGKDAAETERFQTVWSVPRAYCSVESFAASEELDVVSICSPTALHFEHARTLLAAPRAPRLLFIEKPVSETTDQLSALRRAAEERGVLVLINHTRRFDAIHWTAAELVASGALGTLVAGRAVYYGGWRNNGVHLVDALRMILGGELQVASARVVGEERPGDPDLDVMLCVNGAAIRAEPFPERHCQLFEIEIRFSDGRLRLLDFGQQLHVERVATNEFGERELRPVPGFPLTRVDSPLQAAIGEIDVALTRGELGPAAGAASLDSAAATMAVVWDAERLSGGLGVDATRGVAR